jgi:hypothetical protein
MTGEHVIYLGRTIPKAGFRAFIYSFDNAQKLVESWDEYEKNIATGIWFSTKAAVPAKKPYEKARK